MNGKGILIAAMIGGAAALPWASDAGEGAVAEKEKADEAVIAESLKKARQAEEEKKAKVLASMPPAMRDRVGYRENAEKWDAATCRKELEVLMARKQDAEKELHELPAQTAAAKKAAGESNPEIRALQEEIREKQELLKKKLAELDSIKGLETKSVTLRNELGDIEWKRNILQYRLAKLGEKPAEPEKKGAQPKDLHVVE